MMAGSAITQLFLVIRVILVVLVIEMILENLAGLVRCT